MAVKADKKKIVKKINWSNHFLISGSGGIVSSKNLSEIDRNNISDLRYIFKKLKAHLVRDQLITTDTEIKLLVTAAPKVLIFAMKEGPGNFGICVSIGALRAIWNILILSICDNNFLPDYGGEKGTYKIRRRFSRKLIFGPSIIPANGSQQYLKSKKELERYQDITTSRKELCEMLFSYMLDNILYHEAMHITRGHFNFISIYENTVLGAGAGVVKQDNKLFQFFELDADLAALNFVLPTHPELARFQTLTLSEKQDFVFVNMFSNIILNQLIDFEMMGGEIREQWMLDHPPPIIRSLLHDNLLNHYFVEKKLLPKHEVREQQDQAWWEASRIAKKMGFPNGRWHGGKLAGLSFRKIGRIINEFNLFQDIIGRALVTGSYDEYKKAIIDL